jgi:hypothetical protein
MFGGIRSVKIKVPLGLIGLLIALRVGFLVIHSFCECASVALGSVLALA